MTPPVADPSLYLDTGGLAALKREAAAHDPKALRAAAQQFEALFTSMVLKSMRQANFKDPLFGSNQQSLYQDMYDQQVALEISKGPGLGLADMLVQQLRRTGLGGPAGTTGGLSTAGSASTSPQNSGTANLDGHMKHASASAARNLAASATAAAGSSANTSASARASAGTDAASCAATPSQQVAFAHALWPQAQSAARQLGVSPVSLLAQAALETDWGRSFPHGAGGAPSHNLFGIKAGADWTGGAVDAGTQEYGGGKATPVQARFRSYTDTRQCFDDYVSLLRSNPRYAGAIGTGGDTQAFASALQHGGYATDPHYARKVGAVAQSLTHALKLAAAGPMTAGSGAL